MPYLSNPKIWGPGVWFNIHLLAAKATDVETKEFFVQYINTLVKNLPCIECRKHATKYLRDNLLISYLTDSDPEGLFRWSWTFHNFVNTRLSKPFIDWEIARDMFYNEEGVCAGDCGTPLVEGVSVYTKGKSSSGLTFKDW